MAGGAAAVSPAMLTAGDVATQLRATGLSARELGLRFDGRADESAPLQRAIDEAARQKRPLILPPGTARIDRPLDLKGRHVAIVGDPVGNTVVKAGARLARLIDAEDRVERIDSPLFLFGLSLDGSGSTQTGLCLRYRHRTVIDTVRVTACDTGIDERDTWLGRRANCQIRQTRIGWRLGGANHSSQWQGCSITDAREVHLDIGAQGTAEDGNDALLFLGCDVEFGAGIGVRVAPGASATFDTCYLGEDIGGDVLENAGRVTVRGGALFVGHGRDGAGIRAAGGTVTIDGTAIRGQGSGPLDRLAGAGGNGAGSVVFRDVDMQLKLGGNPVLRGNVLGTMPMRVFAPTLGRAWQATQFDCRAEDRAVGDARRVRCLAPTGANPLVGVAGTLGDVQASRTGAAAYIVIVYSATAPVELKATSGAMSRQPWRLIGTLPATREVQTYIKVDVPVNYGDFSLIELIMRARGGDELVLHHATIGDASVIEPGPLANLARAR
ncbi:glycosyl hydrolase family 28-related protein [Sphingomonas yantingensis]|uniref:Rhamnogalacturonase A/B/Epimerase-like pectate lyase domain-containing protein n=1 Tax=Sphingomonas yantingensis TaxID=1241761 RepID=A0A7W9EKZ7_9SPHN|nr:glycosyl hydrolase family 28-related protein [Sphingomonas yantingensis]MBB5700141.1 hypothetical protein [Sphingomonas yantingensis]